MNTIRIQDVSLFVKVVGSGRPLVLMHGGPGLDHNTMLPFRRCRDEFTLIFYDHRCNGRSVGAPVTSMTWENLTADADALRQRLGFNRWAVLGHSFGGMVALEYALRYPKRVSHLILVDTAGHSCVLLENAPRILKERGYSPEVVATARRLFTGQISPDEFSPAASRLATAYYHHFSLVQFIRTLIPGLRIKFRPEAFIFGFSRLLDGWSVMDRLDGIQAPTLVIAGRDDFQFPPNHQAELASGIPTAHLEIIERAGHNVHSERPTEVMELVRRFLSLPDGGVM